MTHRLLLTASLLVGCDAGAESLDRARVTATDTPFAASPAISWPNNLPPLSVHRMQVGYFYVANPAPIDELPGALVRDDDVYVLALPDYPRTFQGQYRGFRVIVANTTDRPVQLLARESSKEQLAIVHEALDQNGNWAPIEYLRFTTCGNSWYTESLAGGSYMDFVAPHYRATGAGASSPSDARAAHLPVTLPRIACTLRRMIEYVDLATARTAKGIRIVTSALVASPWSEAAKGLFTVAELPALVVGKPREGAEITAWTGVDNVPVVLHDNEPARTNWAAIVGLGARLAPDRLVPADPRARAEMFGMLELVAGEDGLGWNARLAMIRASLESQGERGFPLPIATYLATRYGYIAGVDLRKRVGEQLAILRERLGDGPYFGVDGVSALDVYSATFLTPLSMIDDAACPQMTGSLRRAFASARDLLADLVPDELWAHRTRMFERHLSWPIRLY